MICQNCPCHETCIQKPSFCKMAARNPTIEREIKHICEFSKISHYFNKTFISSEPKPVPDKVVMSTGNGSVATIPASESILLSKEMNACPHYQKDSKCGCGRARCLAGKQGEPDSVKNDGSSLVSNWDCYHCLRPDNSVYAENAYVNRYKKGL